jgi:hypothetical protein
MHERTTLRRLGVIVSVGLVSVGLAAFPAYTGADNGGNGNGNGNGNENANANANGNGNGNGGVDHVVICHVPPGNPDNEHTITVGEPAVDAHVGNHSDSLGPCDADTTTTTSTSTTTSSSTTSTSTTSTTTTSAAVAPVAVFDPLAASVGQPVVNLNVLTNDALGTPPATITNDIFNPAVAACAGLSFDPATGAISGTPTGAGLCPFAYEIENSAGSSLALVLVAIA